MSKFLDLGLGISLINVYYSLSYFLMWCVELQYGYDDDVLFSIDTVTFVWLAVYTCNLFLNVFLFLGLRKRDRLAILVWFSLTLLWFLPKLYGHSRGCRLDRRGSTYKMVNLVMEIYVIISFLVMILVYIYLPQRSKRILTKQRSVKDNNDDPRDIQMVDLMDKAAPSNVEEINAKTDVVGCLDQKVTSFEFHKAENGSDDDN
ncbi:uncharacterized protein LOC133842924 isoform X1 [Drosophila sulfurigaster albostrigata]|uniref:uncharacterized protein LOC133842924 isoform X1 n=1 Tax=Drosophila sulfurigaster albostrigata TaxID=89887 RepID=UPI002D21B95F|nr:uncharacterized protein LOC133842924 isoform X1 [Drosophila sulfurigaster albostrigata]